MCMLLLEAVAGRSAPDGVALLANVHASAAVDATAAALEPGLAAGHTRVGPDVTTAVTFNAAALGVVSGYKGLFATKPEGDRHF